MLIRNELAVVVLLAGTGALVAQQPGQPELKIDSANRTLTVNAENTVTVEPEIAILHVGFETLPTDAKAAYTAGATTSNAIIAALKQAGVPESAIRSEWQHLNSVYDKPHKFTLQQQWTVRVKPERAAEVLDIAVTAGANNSGQIDWDVENQQTLQDKALEGAAARACAQAAVLARGMGVKLGALVYVSNQVSSPVMPIRAFAMKAGAVADAAQPLAIEPHKVSSSATVYAVFTIE
jgi:Uncharacterized conserved protein